MTATGEDHPAELLSIFASAVVSGGSTPSSRAPRRSLGQIPSVATMPPRVNLSSALLRDL
jgi:hypothetical protein